MTLVTQRLGKKLREYVKELRNTLKEARSNLSSCVVPDEKGYDTASWALKTSSTLLNKLLTRVQDLQSEIQQALLAKESTAEIDGELSDLLDSADRAEVQAELVLAEIEAKLSYYDEMKNNLDLSLEGVPRQSKGNIYNKDFVDSIIEGMDRSTLDLTEGAESTNTDQVTDTVVESAQSVEPAAEVPQCDFNLKRFYSDEKDFKQFWLEFDRTVAKSPLEAKYKFAALRGLVRGEAYRVFLDLDYHSEKAYHIALSRLSDKYAKQTAELQEELLAKPSTSPMEVEPAAGHTTPSTANTNRWSDEYFFTKYCKTVPNYKTPDRDLLVRAIHAFLNFYVLGPNRVPTKNFANIWNILLHGVQFENRSHKVKINDQYIMELKDQRKFGTDDVVDFENVEKCSQESLLKYAPCLRVEKQKDESKPYLWKWQYSTIDRGTKTKTVISTRDVKEWYTTCWTKVEKCKAGEFQDWVRYFALLSMVLLRVVIKEPESIEKYIVLSFNRTFRAFCGTHFMPNAVPPHAGIYKLIRKTEFKKTKPNFKQYLTYLVGCFAFCDGNMERRHKVRDFLNAGCLLTLRCTGTGSIYWLLKAAERKQMKPQDLLMLFLIDPSMEKQVKTINQFMETYLKKEFTWWWARSFNNRTLKEISTFNCPPFAYASFIVGALNQYEIKMSKDYPQFSRFINDGKSTELYGRNLGMVLRHIVNEWNMTPLSSLTKALYKKIELEKCKEKP